MDISFLKDNMLKIVIVLGCLASFACLKFIVHAKDDCPAEEFLEEVIEEETGVNIDLTPGSPEKV